MELPRRAVFLLGALLALAAVVWSQETCLCKNNKRTTDCSLVNGVCLCKSIGLNITVDCRTLTSKCVLMKAEVIGLKTGRRKKPDTAYVDNDGIYDPECDAEGNFKPKQCNGTETCWCVNSAGARRTEKGDRNITCQEVVRTSWIIIEAKHLERNTATGEGSIEGTIGNAFSERYQLDQKYISVMYEKPFITVNLKQNASEKTINDVDIADVAYYFEKDVKGDTIFSDKSGVKFAEPLQFENTVIYYVDDKPPEFSMKHLTAGVIAVIVVVVLAIVVGILVLIFTRRKRGKYEKAEVKEMNEMHRELNS